MRYEVTLRGPRTATNRFGTVETVIVVAESGDEAAEKAFRPYRIISSVQPVNDDKAALRREYEIAAGKKPFGGWDADTLREKIEALKAPA